MSHQLEPALLVLENFELRTILGTGTFGVVKIVRHKKTGNYYALKILKKNEIIRLNQVTHIRAERNILSRLDHPFIVNLCGSMMDMQNLYMLMEYIPGGEVFTILRRAGQFGNDQSRMYAACIVLALEHMHSRGIVYRDLKPENLLIDQNGFLKITDFGFAKEIRDEKTWTLCGTPEYLAPEIILTQGHDKGVDWWALGILIYEMLAGFPPFYDEEPYGIYKKILRGVRKVEFPREMTAEARDIIVRLLNPDVTQRLGFGSDGAKQVKAHPWFRNFDWAALEKRSLKPPLIPEVRGQGDTRNFDHYPEPPGGELGLIIAHEASRQLFKDF